MNEARGDQVRTGGAIMRDSDLVQVVGLVVVKVRQREGERVVVGGLVVIDRVRLAWIRRRLIRLIRANADGEAIPELRAAESIRE